MARPTFTVALVGPDGTGKTTVSRRLAAVLPFPVKTIYMGINPETSGLMLPTTRLLLSLRHMRGRRTDLVASSDPARAAARPPDEYPAVVRGARSGLALLNWLAEEWFRQGVAAYHKLRGSVIVFDRHFYADYYHFDVAPTSHSSRPIARRVHGFHLAHLYPKPDLVVCLDAPAQIVAGRKREATVEWLERRRQQYLELAETVESFVVVDAAAPLDQVTNDVARVILDFARARQSGEGPRRPARTAA